MESKYLCKKEDGKEIRREKKNSNWGLKRNKKKLCLIGKGLTKQLGFTNYKRVTW